MCVSSKILKKRSNLKQNKTLFTFNFSSPSWSFKLLQKLNAISSQKSILVVNYQYLIHRTVSFFLINVFEAKVKEMKSKRKSFLMLKIIFSLS